MVALALLAVVGLLGIEDLERLKREAAADGAGAPGALEADGLLRPARPPLFSLAKVTAAVRLWFSEPVVLLLAPWPAQDQIV